MLNTLSFEELIIYCCAADETELREQIKKDLFSYNFSFIEDEYRSPRNFPEKTQPGICNTLFTRGKPKVCLVSHTDVYRDHYAFDNEIKKMIPTPTIKDKDGRKIIQDLNCKVQVGGDDRLGVAIALWTAFNSDKDLSILLTTDEEVGLLSAKEVKFKELNGFDLLIQIDRGNYVNQIVSEIRDVQLCDDKMMQFLLDESEKISLKRKEVVGYGTDVFIIKKNKMCKNAVNLTCGYYKGHSEIEYIDIEEARDTSTYVKHILHTLN